MSPRLYGVVSRRVHQCKTLIARKVSAHYIQEIAPLIYCVVDMQCDPGPCEMRKEQLYDETPKY